MSKAKILIVDDSPTHLNMMKAPFESKGYNVFTATDGEEALEVVNAEHPDLVVLDVIMPKHNGFQVCRKIKSQETTQHIKVILLTSKNQKSDEFWGKKQGADLFMTKPFDEDELFNNALSLLS